MINKLAFGFWIGTLLILAATNPGQGQETAAGGSGTQWDETQALLNQAKVKRADLLSPESYQTGQKLFERAQADNQAGKSSERIQKSLDEAGQALKKAIQNAELVSFTFPDLIKAYDDAQAQNAPELVVASFKKADDAFKALVADMEKGDLAKARTNAPQVLELLRQAELEAIQAAILGETRELLRRAASSGVPGRAPESYREAVDALKAAEDFIAAQRYEKEKAQDLATKSAYLGRHAIHLSEWIANLKKGDANWEKLIRQFERELTDIGGALHLDLEFDQDIELPVQAILAAIRSLQEDRQHLQEELAQRDTQIGELEAEVGKLKTETGKYVAELEAKRAELDKRKALEEKINRLGQLFKPEEGTVRQAGDQIILRLSGLRFASGSSALRPENFPLLTKAQQAIREFPDRHIEVQGHTDSQGDDQANQELSQKRAEAVRNYLRQNLNLAEDDISAVGLGESQPIASNDTAAGRAANRRIEIVLTP